MLNNKNVHSWNIFFKKESYPGSHTYYFCSYSGGHHYLKAEGDVAFKRTLIHPQQHSYSTIKEEATGSWVTTYSLGPCQQQKVLNKDLEILRLEFSAQSWVQEVSLWGGEKKRKERKKKKKKFPCRDPFKPTSILKQI